MNNKYEELQSSQPRVTIDVTQTVPTQFIRRSSRLTLNGLNEANDTGIYWCQVRLQNGTTFEEKSKILSLGMAERYQLLSRCMGSSVVDQRNCLRVLRTTGPEVTDGTPLTVPVDQTTPSFSVSPTTPTTTTSTDRETESRARNLVALYAVIAVITAASLIVLLLLITIAVLRHHQQTNSAKPAVPNVYEDNAQPEMEEDGLSETPQGNQDEEFDFKDNMAYNKVGKMILNANISYVTTVVPPRATTPQEYEVFTPTKSINTSCHE